MCSLKCVALYLAGPVYSGSPRVAIRYSVVTEGPFPDSGLKVLFKFLNGSNLGHTFVANFSSSSQIKLISFETMLIIISST